MCKIHINLVLLLGWTYTDGEYTYQEERQTRFLWLVIHMSSTQITSNISPQLKTVCMRPISCNLSHLENRCLAEVILPDSLHHQWAWELPGMLHPTCSRLNAGYTTTSQTIWNTVCTSWLQSIKLWSEKCLLVFIFRLQNSECLNCI